MATQPKPDRELTKVTIGLPGVVSAEIPVQWSIFSWMRQRFSKAPQPGLFLVPWMRAQVSAAEDDDGTLDIYLSVLNMSVREMRVEHLFLERVIVNGSELSTMAPMFTPPQDPVSPHSIQKIYFRMPLNAPAIRLLLQVIQKAQNLYSTPRMDLTVVGTFDVSVKGRHTESPFTVTCQPELTFRCQSAKL